MGLPGMKYPLQIWRCFHPISNWFLGPPCSQCGLDWTNSPAPQKQGGGARLKFLLGKVSYNSQTRIIRAREMRIYCLNHRPLGEFPPGKGMVFFNTWEEKNHGIYFHPRKTSSPFTPDIEMMVGLLTDPFLFEVPFQGRHWFLFQLGTLNHVVQVFQAVDGNTWEPV